MKNKQEKNKKGLKSGKVQKKEKAASRTIFIGGLPLQSKPKDIANYLAFYDVVESLKVPKDPATGKLKGFAKAVLKTLEGVERVVSEPCHYIGGLKVGINQWKDTSTYVQEKRDESERKVYIKYPPGLSTNLLIEYFLQFGEILNVDYKRNPSTNKNRYFCYITYKFVDSINLILSDQQHWISGFLVIAELSKPQRTDANVNESYDAGSEENKQTSFHIREIKKGENTRSVLKMGEPKDCSDEYIPKKKGNSSKKCYSNNLAQADYYESFQPDNWLDIPSQEDRQNSLLLNRIKESNVYSDEKRLQQISGNSRFFPDLLSGVSLNHLSENNLRFNVCLVPFIIDYLR